MIRTCDARFRKPTLYPLSYGGWIDQRAGRTGTTPTAYLEATLSSPGRLTEALTKFLTNAQPISRFGCDTGVMAIFRRHTRPTQPPPESDSEREFARAELPVGVAVLLSPGLADMAAPLMQALGAGFVVETDGPGVSGVMIIGPAGPAGLGFLRASHPGVVLLVVDRRGSGPRPAEAVAHLEAGADGYLANPPIAEVASHVRALARRARPTGAAPARAPAQVPAS
jgi:hypothetical protein